jgi:hypothetical protein
MIYFDDVDIDLVISFSQLAYVIFHRQIETKEKKNLIEKFDLRILRTSSKLIEPSLLVSNN